MQKSIPRSLLIFYVLGIYVFLQFCWWFYLLFDLTTEVYQLKEQVLFLNGSEEPNGRTLPEMLVHKQIMVLGEGMVFLLLLTLGMLRTRRSFRRETNAARQQKNFLLSVTHELKSPVASVKLFLETIAKRDLGKEKQAELVHKAIEESNRLDQLIENILVTARIDNHAFQLHFEASDLSELVIRFVEQFNLGRLSATVAADIEKNIFVMVDQMAVQSILFNLVENAIKYSPGINGAFISLHTENGYAILKVKDQGTGIKPDDKSRVFEKFFRAGNEETRNTKGTGLGLFIVKYLVVQHLAAIAVYDNAPQGSVFEIRFKSIANA